VAIEQRWLDLVVAEPRPAQPAPAGAAERRASSGKRKQTRETRARPAAPMLPENRRTLGRALLLGYVAAAALVIVTSVMPAVASMAMIEARAALNGGDFTAATPKLAEAWDTSRLTRYDTVYSIVTELQSSPIVRALSVAAPGKELLQAMRSHCVSETRKHWRDARLITMCAGFLVLHGMETNSLELKQEALQLMTRASELAPNRQDMVLMLARTYFALGNKAKAMELVRRAVDLDPTIGETWLRAGIMLRTDANDSKAAATYILRSRSVSKPATFFQSLALFEEVTLVAEAYANANDLNGLLSLVEELLASPGAIQVKPLPAINLARAVEFALRRAGRSDMSLRDRLLRLAAKKDPSVEEKLAPLWRGNVQNIDQALFGTSNTGS
jgi:tetratricopeptide (TPR) repeat protein